LLGGEAFESIRTGCVPDEGITQPLGKDFERVLIFGSKKLVTIFEA